MYLEPEQWQELTHRSCDIMSKQNIKLFAVLFMRVVFLRDTAYSHNLPLNRRGQTFCAICEQPMDIEEVIALRDSGRHSDTCDRCQCKDRCPECGGHGLTVIKRIAPDNYVEKACPHCEGTGLYDVYQSNRVQKDRG